MEELTENAEEPDDGDSKKEEQKLGKLQYKVGSFILLKDKWRIKAVQRVTWVRFDGFVSYSFPF